jgi:hypothetical protein
MVPFALMRLLKQGGYGRLHDNISLHGLPFLQTEGALRREFARLKKAVPEIIPVVGRYVIPIPGNVDALSFDAFERHVTAAGFSGPGR